MGADMGRLKAKIVKLFVCAALCFSFTYFIFLDSLNHNHESFRRRTRRNAHDHGTGRLDGRNPLDRLSGGSRKWPASFSLERYRTMVRFYYGLAAFLHLMFIVSNFILCLLDLDSLESYRYLDCFMVGRVTLDGRYSRAAKYAAVVFCIFQFTWLVIMVYARPKFDLVCLEFLIHERDDISKCEASMTSEQKLTTEQRRNFVRWHDVGLLIAMVFEIFEPKDRPIKMHTFGEFGFHLPPSGPMKELKRHKRSSKTRRIFPNRHMLRPTRTLSSWQRLVNLTCRYATFWFLALLLAAPLMVKVLLPMFITQKGFELNYANCVDYLSRRSNLYERSFKFLNLDGAIFERRADGSSPSRDTPRVSILPLVNIRPVNSFELLRLSLDVTSSLLFWTLTLAAFVFDTYIVVLIAADTLIYSKVVRARIKSLLAELDGGVAKSMSAPRLGAHEIADSTGKPHLGSPPVETTGSPEGPRQRRQGLELVAAWCGQEHEAGPQQQQQHRQGAAEASGLQRRARQAQVSAEILVTQTMLVDFFRMIERHNTYVSFYLMACIMLWLAFSFINVLCLMDLNLRGLLGRREVYAMETFSSLYFVIICALFATTRQLIHGTYTRLAAIMALDNTSEGTKERWCAIMRYFYPVPLYCFSMFRSSEISWLFCIKVSDFTDQQRCEVRARAHTHTHSQLIGPKTIKISRVTL